MDLALRPVWLTQLNKASYQPMRGKNLQFFEREISTPENFGHKSKVIHLFINQLYGITYSGSKGNIFGKYNVISGKQFSSETMTIAIEDFIQKRAI